MWIFTYGSELWEKDFPHLQRVPGCVTKFARRMWMVDEENVGLPELPGRVVTLVQTNNPKDIVWGAAYEISAENEEAITELLDFREKPNFSKHTVTFYPVPSCREQEIRTVIPFKLIIYCPTDDNKLFKKDEPIEDTAVSIATAQGVKGTNADYLFNLVREMKNIAPNYEDKHIFALSSVVEYIKSNTEMLESA